AFLFQLLLKKRQELAHVGLGVDIEQQAPDDENQGHKRHEEHGNCEVPFAKEEILEGFHWVLRQAISNQLSANMCFTPLISADLHFFVLWATPPYQTMQTVTRIILNSEFSPPDSLASAGVEGILNICTLSGR